MNVERNLFRAVNAMKCELREKGVEVYKGENTISLDGGSWRGCASSQAEEARND